MCGFVGIVDFTGRDVPSELVSAMRATLRHRGPDASGDMFTAPSAPIAAALGFCRLSILDLSPLGNQPMSASPNGPWLVFNGEIYNHREIRARLESRGIAFRSRSDSEVLLRLLELSGSAAVHELRGMFAFAWVDVKRRAVLLARDRLGKKPLYYRWHAGRLSFASELKALLRDPETARTIDPEALDCYLRYQYVPSPLSILAGVRKLEPGHTLIADEHGYRAERYWTIDFSAPRPLSHEDALAQTRQLVDDAVRVRLESDVPLGAFLSGGIDSAIVTTLMARHMRQPVQTFSIGFDESAFDERDSARVIAQRVGADHHELVVRMDASATLPDLAWAYDEPFGDSSALPTFHVARLTRQHVTVALSGDGGDEAFAGYERYAAGVLASRLSPVARLPVVRTLGNALFRSGRQAPTRTMRRALQRLWEGLAESNAATRYTAWMTIARERQLASLYREPYRPSESAGRYLQHIYDTPNGRLAALDRMQRLDILTYLPEDLLVKVDRASMANSLEVRAPFLDHHVMEFAASLPASLRLPGLRLKSLLKRAFAPELPRSTRRRRKRGFGVPISAWFRRELHRDLEQMVLARDARISAYLRQDTIRQWLAEHRAGTVDHAPLLWSLLMLEHWQRTHLG